MTPFNKKFSHLSEFRKSVGIIELQDDKNERFYEPIWTRDISLVKAHIAFPHEYPASSNPDSEFCWRLMERQIPSHLVKLLQPTEYFIDQGVKYLKIFTNSTPLTTLIMRHTKGNKDAPYEFSKCDIVQQQKHRKIAELEDSICITQSILSNIHVTDKMTHAEIDAEKEKMEKYQRQLDLLNSNLIVSGPPGVGYF